LQYQGDEIKDTDIPPYLEAKLFCTTFGKFIWVIKKPTTLEFVNTVIQLISDVIVTYFFGERRSKNIFQKESKISIFRRTTSRLPDFRVCYGHGFAPGSRILHFGALHVQERLRNVQLLRPPQLDHVQRGVPQRTPDFPYVPGSRLPDAVFEIWKGIPDVGFQVKKIAPEFYDDLPQHNPWTAVLYDFVMDPDVGPYARMKRKVKGLES
jgi:sphingolipid delta-4 desaturase